jgi:hypothetical protein
MHIHHGNFPIFLDPTVYNLADSRRRGSQIREHTHTPIHIHTNAREEIVKRSFLPPRVLERQ